MKISTLEQAMRAFVDGPLTPVLASLNGARVLDGPGLTEFAEAARTLAGRVGPAIDEPKVPLNWT